MSNYKES